MNSRYGVWQSKTKGKKVSNGRSDEGKRKSYRVRDKVKKRGGGKRGDVILYKRCRI